MFGNYINSILFVSFALNLFLAFIIISKGIKDKINILFSLLSFSVAGWSLSIFGYYSLPDIGLNWLSGTHTFALAIGLIFLYFCQNFPKKNKQKILSTYLPAIIFIILSGLIIFSDFVIGNRIEMDYKINTGYVIYQLVLISYFTAGFYFLIKQKNITTTREEKNQINYVFSGSIISSFLAIATNLILPFLGIFDYTWLGPIFTLILVGSIFIAIGRYHLFNIRVIATETFIFLLWGFLLIRALVSNQIVDILVNFGLLIATVFIGIFLIRSVLKEVSQREKIEKLAEDLGKANERLKELDKQKTEFVSIASHQLRSPLTAIKGYSSMLIEGSFGPIPKKAQGALEVVFQSSQKMISVIEDFLNITRIELGRMKYEMSDIDIGALAKQVTEEQRPQVVKNGLKLEFEDDGHDHNVYADMGKLNQVFNNIIDNAGKYTKEGWIRVRVENMTKPEGEEVVRFVVKDSGVGIPAETLPKLFEKFVRAYDAGKVNLIGTGLGLYVAKQIVEGLGGKIWAESEGKGKGSTFIVELKHIKPLAEQEKEKKVVDFVAGI